MPQILSQSKLFYNLPHLSKKYLWIFFFLKIDGEGEKQIAWKERGWDHMDWGE